MNTAHPTPYTLQELSVLVEEYITQQRSEFTLKGLCTYIVYWGMEDGRLQSHLLPEEDLGRVKGILECIVRDGRIRVQGDGFVKAFI